MRKTIKKFRKGRKRCSRKIRGGSGASVEFSDYSGDLNDDYSGDLNDLSDDALSPGSRAGVLAFGETERRRVELKSLRQRAKDLGATQEEIDGAGLAYTNADARDVFTNLINLIYDHDQVAQETVRELAIEDVAPRVPRADGVSRDEVVEKIVRPIANGAEPRGENLSAVWNDWLVLKGAIDEAKANRKEEYINMLVENRLSFLGEELSHRIEESSEGANETSWGADGIHRVHAHGPRRLEELSHSILYASPRSTPPTPRGALGKGGSHTGGRNVTKQARKRKARKKKQKVKKKQTKKRKR